MFVDTTGGDCFNNEDIPVNILFNYAFLNYVFTVDYFKYKITKLH